MKTRFAPSITVPLTIVLAVAIVLAIKWII